MFTYQWVVETKTHLIFSYQMLDNLYLQVHLHHEEESLSTPEIKWCSVTTNLKSIDQGRLLLTWLQLNCEIYSLPAELIQYLVTSVYESINKDTINYR